MDGERINQNYKVKYSVSLLEQLKKYGDSEVYPFHMPGHKRMAELGITSFPNPFSVDITEIDGFDNLHHAEGILKESMERAAAIYGADRSYYLINGSTAGILSAVCGTVKPGERLLMARNCHKSVYHAAVLQRIEPVYVYPEPVNGMSVPGGIRAEQVREALEQNSDVRAVFITSPTYEGILSDVAAIAKEAHRIGIPLIVDEAHGAHLSFGSSENGFPSSSLSQGADVVIQSLHKTLPALTQTAILHVKSELVKPEQIERYLPLFQTSSPSYPLMASIENAVFYMDSEGRKRMDAYGARLRRFMEQAGGWKYLQILTDQVCGCFGVWARDPSKLVVFPGGAGLTGPELTNILRKWFGLEPEMACRDYVILMTSLMDTEEGFDRLSRALQMVDEEAGKRAAERVKEKTLTQKMVQETKIEKETIHVIKQPTRGVFIQCVSEMPGDFLSPAKAWHSEKKQVLLQEAGGRICGGFVTVYPPGIPLLVPGERITEEIVRQIEDGIELGLTVEGVERMV